MGEEIALENGRISDFQGLVTLTLDRVILHTIMRHSSTSTYIPNFIEIEETFCGRTDGRTDARTGGQTFETDCIRSTQMSRPNKNKHRRGKPECLRRLLTQDRITFVRVISSRNGLIPFAVPSKSHFLLVEQNI